MVSELVPNTSNPDSSVPPEAELTAADQEELANVVNVVALSDGTVVLFAIAPDSAPKHPVTLALKTELAALGESEFLTLYYSDDSLFKFLNRLDRDDSLSSPEVMHTPPHPSPCQGEGVPVSPLSKGGLRGVSTSSQHSPQDTQPERRVVMAFGLEQLPLPRLRQEMQQLNLGRERIFARNLVLVFWLNRESFLDEFRSHAADFWDWHTSIARFTTRPPVDPLLYPYLEWMIAENSHLKMSGIMQVNRQVDIFLDQIYVSLKGEWVESHRESVWARGSVENQSIPNHRTPDKRNWVGNMEHGPDNSIDGLGYSGSRFDWRVEAEQSHKVTRTVDLAEAVRQNSYSVILGDPGAGKTTLLRYLARHFALAQRDYEPNEVGNVQGGQQEDLGPLRLPILFRIADYAERLAKQPDLTLVGYLEQFYRQWQGHENVDGEAITNLLLKKMGQGDCLLLLDGLDEVFDQAHRALVVERMQQLVNDYSANKFVITSRVAGYREAALGGRFREFTITPMDDTQIEQFLQRWCLAIEEGQRPDADKTRQQRDAKRETEGIMAAISTQASVKRFAANPLLLTILALIHRNGTHLPQRRVDLYELATKTLIEDWQFGRNVPYGVRHRELSLKEESVLALLAPLAFWMHEEKPSGLVKQVQAEEWLIPYMIEVQGCDQLSALELVQQFLRTVRDATGIFVERANGAYGFMHLTFEEYFSARHIADNDTGDILSIINAHRYQPRWQEPILLALGYLSNQPKRLHRVLKQLFAALEEYQPLVVDQDLRLKSPSAPKPVLVWFEDGQEHAKESELLWMDLLLAGQVLTEINVRPDICQCWVEKLVLTYVGLELDYDDELSSQVLRLLRGIEQFNGYVLKTLRQIAENKQFSEEQRNRAWAAIIYVVCAEPGASLVEQITQVIDGLTPELFVQIRDLVAELGAEITSALERTLEELSFTNAQSLTLTFMIGFSYLRSDHYDHVIKQLEPLIGQVSDMLAGYVYWLMAIAYENKENYSLASQTYEKCSQKMLSWLLWRNWGWCKRIDGKYAESLECYNQALAISKKLGIRKKESNILWNIGRTYQDWGKFQEAIDAHEKSLAIDQELKIERDIGNQYFWIANTYKQWGKYEEAVKFQQKALEFRTREEDQARVALSLYQLGEIYQNWNKYEEAIAHHEKSRDLYQELDQKSNVANQWSNLADCYLDWGKYKKAIEAQEKNKVIREELGDKSSLALAYFYFGKIYKKWNKYEEAIAHYKKSHNLYQNLDKKSDVGDLWYHLASCYCDWGKYQLAIDAQRQVLEIREKLNDESGIAFAYFCFGEIYQRWNKYEEAIAHYEKSRDLYQELDIASGVASQYRSLASCYENWGKYIEAIAHYKKSQNIYHRLDNEKLVAYRWYALANCYRLWGKYEKALECEQQDLALCQKLDLQEDIALAHNQFGRIYQSWEKYEEAIAYHQQSLDLYETLDLQQDVANQCSWIASCYCSLQDYTNAIDYYIKSLNIHQHLNNIESVACCLRQLANTKRLYAKDVSNDETVFLLQQAKQHLKQAFDLNSEGRYRENLAYDQIFRALLIAESLRWEGVDDGVVEFREAYEKGLERFAELGQVVESAAEALDIARAYLEIEPLRNLEQAEALAQQSLQTFQEFNRRKQQALAYRLLGEIYLQRMADQGENRNEERATATQYLNSSLQLYRELTIDRKIQEVEELLGKAEGGRMP